MSYKVTGEGLLSVFVVHLKLEFYSFIFQHSSSYVTDFMFYEFLKSLA